MELHLPPGHLFYFFFCLFEICGFGGADVLVVTGVCAVDFAVDFLFR